MYKPWRGGTYGALFHKRQKKKKKKKKTFNLNGFFSFFLSLRVNLQCKPLFSKQAFPLLTKIMFIIFTTSWYDIKGELHPQPKISIFSALSQNYHLLSKLSKELKNGIEILVGQIVFKLWIKTVKILLW